ncbi:MAG: peptide chain release factor N(5)-glutamine methyltransferase, partial [Rhodocyclaceae bacterium]|nr:peptide chain release factor N(5)-glutamine methyltransferase [Rhodocyclaceae bacterium]
PRLSAEMLLSHVFACQRMHLYTQADRPASPAERDQLRDLVARALKHEPVQYLVNEAWFFSLQLKSDRRALIPRPSTETIVETILQHARTRHADTPLRIADICTGSGCIAISLARNLPTAQLIATDISPDALALARENAERHAVADRIEFHKGDLLAPLAAHHTTYDYIASNPPYIPDHEWDAVEPNVKDYEPTIAL